MRRRFLLCMCLFSLFGTLVASAQPAESRYDHSDDSWNWSYGSDEGGGGSAYLGVDIADVSAERLGELKLKEEHGAEVTMVDQDAPAGKAGLHEHDVILSLNGAAVESAAQLRRMIKETPAGRVVNLGISRDGQPMTVKIQLADRHKSMTWEPNGKEFNFKMPDLPTLPEMPVSVVVVHQSARSGLMVENITPQLGEFFGVKGGNGVLVRNVEKGSRGEKAGFRAGDVVVKVNNEPVHDASDFTHALRSSSNGTVAVTVVRDKKEQSLTLTIPEKKDSGSLLEDSFDVPDLTAEMEQAINRARDEFARLAPALADKMRQEADAWKDRQKRLQERQEEMQKLQEKMRERQASPRRGFSQDAAEI